MPAGGTSPTREPGRNVGSAADAGARLSAMARTIATTTWVRQIIGIASIHRAIPMTFDPTQFGFVQLKDFRIADSVSAYEYQIHSAVDGTKDFLRLNLYLTLDGTYGTIWHGLLEPLFAEAEFADGRLASVARPADMDFIHSYNEDLFRGDIDSEETAEHI